MKDLKKNLNGTRSSARMANAAFILIMLGTILNAGCIGRLVSGGGPDRSDGGGRPAASPVERPLQITSPRKLKYAELEFTVAKAVISTPAAGEQAEEEGASAVVTLSVVNPTKEDIHIRDGQWQLALGDGSVDKQPYSLNIDSRETKETKIPFRVPLHAQWGGAKLTLDEEGKQPASVLLDGDVQSPQFPARLSTGATANTKDPAMTYTIESATVDLDGSGSRAEIGKRYLNLIVRVVDQEAGSAGQFLPEFFRLLIDGQPSSPENTGDKTTVAPQGTEDFTMYFVIPETAEHVELEVGKPEIQTTEKIPIDLKANSPKG